MVTRAYGLVPELSKRQSVPPDNVETGRKRAAADIANCLGEQPRGRRIYNKVVSEDESQSSVAHEKTNKDNELTMLTEVYASI